MDKERGKRYRTLDELKAATRSFALAELAKAGGVKENNVRDWVGKVREKPPEWVALKTYERLRAALADVQAFADEFRSTSVGEWPHGCNASFVGGALRGERPGDRDSVSRRCGRVQRGA